MIKRSKDEFYGKEEGEKEDEADVAHDGVVGADVLALGDQQPPDRHHRPVLLPHVLVVVQHPCHVTVAVVAADVVHALLVGPVPALDVVVKLAVLAGVDFKDDILVRLSEGEVILRDVVGARKIVDHAVSPADPSVTDARQEPCDQRQRCPRDAEREPRVLGVHLCQLGLSSTNTKKRK